MSDASNNYLYYHKMVVLQTVDKISGGKLCISWYTKLMIMLEKVTPTKKMEFSIQALA